MIEYRGPFGSRYFFVGARRHLLKLKGVYIGAWHDGGPMRLPQYLIIGLFGLSWTCGMSAPLPESSTPVALTTLQVVPEEALNAGWRATRHDSTDYLRRRLNSIVRPSTTYTNSVRLKLLRE